MRLSAELNQHVIANPSWWRRIKGATPLAIRVKLDNNGWSEVLTLQKQECPVFDRSTLILFGSGIPYRADSIDWTQVKFFRVSGPLFDFPEEEISEGQAVEELKQVLADYQYLAGLLAPKDTGLATWLRVRESQLKDFLQGKPSPTFGEHLYAVTQSATPTPAPTAVQEAEVTTSAFEVPDFMRLVEEFGNCRWAVGFSEGRSPLQQAERDNADKKSIETRALIEARLATLQTAAPTDAVLQGLLDQAHQLEASMKETLIKIERLAKGSNHD